MGVCLLFAAFLLIQIRDVAQNLSFLVKPISSFFISRFSPLGNQDRLEGPDFILSPQNNLIGLTEEKDNIPKC